MVIEDWVFVIVVILFSIDFIVFCVVLWWLVYEYVVLILVVVVEWLMVGILVWCDFDDIDLVKWVVICDVVWYWVFWVEMC